MGVKKMHTRDGISFGSFIEDSINYQNEEVYTLYAIIFLVLAVICTDYYQYTLFVDRESRKGRY
jgi:hypothetical protein